MKIIAIFGILAVLIIITLDGIIDGNDKIIVIPNNGFEGGVVVNPQ